jgi:hypothetical protein
MWNVYNALLLQSALPIAAKSFRLAALRIFPNMVQPSTPMRSVHRAGGTSFLRSSFELLNRRVGFGTFAQTGTTAMKYCGRTLASHGLTVKAYCRRQ